MMRGYGIALVKNGVKLGTAGAKIQRIEYDRVVDGISKARVDLVTAGDNCCGQLAAVDHWNTDLLITTYNSATGKDEVLWRGPVRKPTFRRGSVTIEATDILSWLQVRMLEQAFDFVNEDVSDIFIDLATYALSKDPNHHPVYEFVRYLSGTTESRTIDTSALRMTWNVVTEMLNAGLDVTTFGSRIVVGVPAFTAIELKDTDVQGTNPAEIAKDGDEYINRVLSSASRDIVGIWPPGPATGSDGFPLVEGSLSDSQLPDVASATAAAKARFEFAQGGVRRVRASGGLILLPTSGIDHRKLIAGQIFNYQATETCYAAKESLRLGRLANVVEKGGERVTIDLQPVGSMQGDATLSSV
jgi:hypothetical protein